MKKPTKKRIAITVISLLILAGGITALVLAQKPQSNNTNKKSNEPLSVSDVASDKTPQKAQTVSISAYIFKDENSYFASGPEKQSTPLALDFANSELNPEEYVTGTVVAQSSEDKPPEAPQITEKGPYVITGELTRNNQGDETLTVTSIKEAKE